MRIAHITDLHLRHHLPGTAPIPKRRSRDALELFRSALADARSRGTEVVAVTGDLVDIGDYLFDHERNPAADARSWEAVRADYRLIRDLLDENGLPWIALPGNHDSQKVMTEVFGERPRIVEHGGVRFVSFWDREHHNHAPQRILADRRRFEAAVRDPDPMPQVHLQHFVITPQLNDSYPHTYVEGEMLTERMAASEQVVLSLSGHYHRGVAPQRHGRTTFSVTPALTEAPHPYRIFDLDPHTHELQWEQVELGTTTRPAVFLDRDGCINTLPTYHSGPEAMEIIPGAATGIRRLRDAGYRVVVVTNQTCVGIGYVTPGVLAEVHDRMGELLAAEGAAVDAIYASTDAGDDGISPAYRTSGTHKPEPTMLLRAAEDLDLDLASSWMVGDRITDVQAGLAAGATPLLVRTGHGRRVEREWDEPLCEVVDDVAAVAATVLRHREEVATP